MANKKKFKILRNILICAGVVIGVPAILLGTVAIYSKTYSIPKQEERFEHSENVVQAHNRSLYDVNGDRLVLQGVNFGNIFLQEGWLSPFALEPLKNEDGTYQKDKDGNLQYPEFCEEQMISGLLSNPNCGEENYDLWFDTYFNSWVNDSDYTLIKDELGLNCIRLPVYWRNFLNDDFTRKDEAVAFKYIDKILEKCKEHDIYVVLDLHGAPGSQNGFEHSGYPHKESKLWDNEEYINATVDCWRYIATYYGSESDNPYKATIATFDILNEPQESHKGVTTKKCWDVFDRIYDAIRETGDKHVITMEGCWSFSTLPDPKDYGWENVQYEYHWYNFQNHIISYDLFYMFQDMNNMLRNFNVPVFIGEFTYFEDTTEWKRGLELFEKRGYSWTVWNFKACTVGWWDTSWGLLSCPLNLDTATEETKCNVSTCTFEEFQAACESVTSDKCNKKTLYNVLLDYKNSK